MRRPYLALSTAVVAAAALSVPVLKAQPFGGSQQAESPTTDSHNPASAARSARHLLRNGLDYLELDSAERALELLREAENRQFELTEAERKDLQIAIERARQTMRGAASGVPGEAPPLARRMSARGRPGGIAVSTPTSDPRSLALPDAPVQLVGGTIDASALPAPAPSAAPPEAPTPLNLPSLPTAPPVMVEVVDEPVFVPAPELPPTPELPSTPELPVDGLASPEGPPSLADEPLSLPELPLDERPEPAAEPAPVDPYALPDLPASAPAFEASAPPIAPEAVTSDLPKAVPSLAEVGSGLPHALQEIPDSPVLAIDESPAVEPFVPPASYDGSPTVEPIDPRRAAFLEAMADEAAIVDEVPTDLVVPIVETGSAWMDEPADLPELPAPPSLDAPAARAPLDPAILPELSRSAASDPGASAPELPVGLTLEPAGDTDDVESAPVSSPSDPALEAVQVESPLPPLPPPAEELSAGGAGAPALPPLPAGADVADAGAISPPIPPVALEVQPTTSPAAAASAPLAPTTLPASTAFDADRPLPPLPGSTSLPGDTVGRLSANGLALPDHVMREVEEIARLQREDLGGRGADLGVGADLDDEAGLGGLADPEYGFGSGGLSNPSMADFGEDAARIELPRPPSPTQARPMRAIPVPEEYEPLEPRRWTPSRKVWAAPGTCHGPLYFQDAVLERYGQGVEQALGPHWGRYTSYPLDDPRQSTQRNQILQPLYSIGLFAGQVALLPYNMLMDPPWEPEYDLGYYRPGDRIPPDTYYLPVHGVGPPLQGRDY